MGFAFDTEHSIQLVGQIFSCFQRKSLSLMKVLKLLYIADRESLKRKGYPLTGDTACAMDHGPVLSHIYNLIKGEASSDGLRWNEYFEKHGHSLRLVKAPGTEELSRHDTETIEEVCRTHWNDNQFRLSDMTHDFPEWQKNLVEHSSRPIPLCDILSALGRAEDIPAIEQVRREEHHYLQLLQGC